jgi:hypothetical protein
MIGIKCVKKIYEPVGKPPKLRNTLLINSHYLDDTYSGYNLFLRQKKMLKQANLKLLDDRMMKNLGKLYAGKDKYG